MKQYRLLPLPRTQTPGVPFAVVQPLPSLRADVVSILAIAAWDCLRPASARCIARSPCRAAWPAWARLWVAAEQECRNTPKLIAAPMKHANENAR